MIEEFRRNEVVELLSWYFAKPSHKWHTAFLKNGRDNLLRLQRCNESAEWK